MLKRAWLYKGELQKAWEIWCTSSDSKYYTASSYISYTLNIKNDDWECVQYVSVGNTGAINGYFTASYDREVKKIYSVGITLLNASISAKKDMYLFFNTLINDRRFNKIEWYVIVGNDRAERLYDNICKRFGGCIIGTYKQSVALRDGSIYDKKLYEIFTEIARKKSNDVGIVKELMKK